jgi:hypothetical protein
MEVQPIDSQLKIRREAIGDLRLAPNEPKGKNRASHTENRVLKREAGLQSAPTWPDYEREQPCSAKMRGLTINSPNMREAGV